MTCTVESLKDGLDYTGSVNRLRFDMEAAPIYAGVIARAGELLQRAGLDWVQVDEVVYAGGSTCLPGLNSMLRVKTCVFYCTLHNKIPSNLVLKFVLFPKPI